MTATALEQLTRSCGTLAAEGTDPALLAALLAWTVRPRRSLESLRRRAGAAGVATDEVARHLLGWARAEVDGGDAVLGGRCRQGVRAAAGEADHAGP